MTEQPITAPKGLDEPNQDTLEFESEDELVNQHTKN
jgi:hypothetical protein